MASVERRPLLDEAPGAAGLEGLKTTEWRPSAIATDIATLGVGTVLGGLFNVALVFLIPKLISVEDYGYWRLFGLYGAYAGFFHLGLADGALLRWAGHSIEEFHDEIGPATRFLLWQHVVVLVPLCAIAALLLPRPLRFVAIAIGAYAILVNVTALLQYALQGARIFRPVAISAVAAPALFCLLVLLWASKWPSNSREVVSLFVLAWSVPAVFLLAWTKPWSGPRRLVGAGKLAKECVLSGWPILMANCGMMLITYADRLAVSWASTIYNFAQYSLAASAMAVPITAIQVCNKVFFSHLAGVAAERRKRIYGISSLTLLTAWAVLLPYDIVLGAVVRRFLPKYIPSLPYARVLLLGIPFLAAIQIVQMSFAYLNSMQRRFLIRSLGVLAMSLILTSLAAFYAGSLTVVAAAQVVILGLWWLFNEWTLRDLTEQTRADWLKFLVIYGLVSASYWIATGSQGAGVASVGYYTAIGLIFAVTCRRELRDWVRVVASANERDGYVG